MSAAPRKPMSLPEFLAWEERQEERFEFDGVAPVAMTSGTARHDIIRGTLRALLTARLRGSPCRAWGPLMKIEVAGRIRYPDVFVSCTPYRDSQTVMENPVVVFEVVSSSTYRIDHIDRRREYQATPSIQRYVILEQDSIAGKLFARAGDIWPARPLTRDDTLDMPEIGLSVPLAEIYAELDFSKTDEAAGRPA